MHIAILVTINYKYSNNKHFVHFKCFSRKYSYGTLQKSLFRFVKVHKHFANAHFHIISQHKFNSLHKPIA